MSRFDRRMILLLCFAAMSLCEELDAQGPSRGVQDIHAATVSSTKPGPYYALVIGNNTYRSVNRLQTAVGDARSVAALLQDSYGFNTKLLLDASRDQIVTALTDYRRNLPEESNLLIYFAGHGYHDRETGEAYWLPVDADKDNPEHWISANDITSNLRAVPARHILVISDSCYSGVLTRDADIAINPSEQRAYLDKMLASKSRNLMSSGGDEPVADSGPSGHSVFANAILEGLRGMTDQQFTASDLFQKFIKRGVAGSSEQVPQYSDIRNSGDAFGDFVFSRRGVVGKTIANGPPPTPTPAPPTPAPTLGSLSLNGSGAAFPSMAYAKWFDLYHKDNPSVQVNYQVTGSGGGIRQILAGSVDFAASDGPMSDAQLQQSPIKILHIPTLLNAVVPAYNVRGVTAEIKFTPDSLAGIFLGKVKSWKDPLISSANPGISFPDEPIVVVHRADGSATTFVFTDYLSKVNSEWQSKVGKGTSINWPVGLSGKGNEGVLGMIRQVEGSIGFLELIYATQNNSQYGSVKNAAGNFVKANSISVERAADSVADTSTDYRVSITNPPGHDAYPIAGFTWLLIPTPLKDDQRGKVLMNLLNWILTKGQPLAADLGYVPLPKRLAEKEREDFVLAKH